MGGGLNVADNPIIVKPNQMVVADNILMGTSLARRKRGGQASFHTSTYQHTASYPTSVTGDPIRGLIEFWRFEGSPAQPTSDVFLHQSTKVWSIQAQNAPGIDRTGALSLDATSVPSYEVFNGNLYFCSSVAADGYNKWDGASASSAAVAEPADGNGTMIRAHLNRMWMAGNPDFPYRLYYSSTGDPEEWGDSAPDDGGSLDLDPDNDPSGITAIFPPMQGRLYVATRRRIYEITGSTPDDFVVRPLTKGIGCISHQSAVATPNDILFCSDRGSHSLRKTVTSDQSEVTFISRDIQTLWTELLSSALFHRTWAMYEENINSYMISVPSSGQIENDTLLIYNIEFGTWTVWPNIDARSLCPYMVTNRAKILLGKETGGLIFINEDVGTDLGSPFSSRFKTGVIYPGGNPMFQRRYKSITVLSSATRSGQFSVGWNVDGQRVGSKVVDVFTGNTDFLGTTFVLGASKLGVGQFLPTTITIEEVGYGIQLEFISPGTADIEIYGFLLEVEDVNETYT